MRVICAAKRAKWRLGRDEYASDSAFKFCCSVGDIIPVVWFDYGWSLPVAGEEQ